MYVPKCEVNEMGIKDIRRSYILERAIKIFCERSIAEVKIKDVAEYCNIGEATFYRYFSKKSALVLACALRMQEKVVEYYSAELAGRGFDKLSRFYYRFYEYFGDHPDYYRFLSDFDGYCINQEISDLETYSDGLDFFKKRFDDAYREGIEDGSVREIREHELFYYSTTHGLLSLCKKLAAQGHIVRQDDLTDNRQEVRMMIEIILNYLKK